MKHLAVPTSEANDGFPPRPARMIKAFIAALGWILSVPIVLGFAIFSFVYEESMATKLYNWLNPSADILLPCALSLAFIAMPLLYLNRRTRFYAGIGLGICGLYLLAISWLQCLWVAQQTLPAFLFKLSNLLPYLGCLLGSLVGLPLKGEWGQLVELVFLVVGALGSLYGYFHVMEHDDLSEADADAPWTYQLAMAILWLQMSLIVVVFTLLSSFLIALDENPWPYVIIGTLAVAYEVLVGLGVAYRWKIALPFALTSQGSMALAAYGQFTKADWHVPTGLTIAVLMAAVMVACIVAGLCLLIPDNLRFYFAPEKPRSGFTQG